MVSIVITDKCNLKCGYCIYEKSQPQTISKCVIDKILDTTYDDDLTGIFIFGGEPTLATDIIEYICGKYMKRSILFRYITFPTNLVDICDLEDIVKKYPDIKFNLLVGYEGENNFTEKSKYSSTILSNINTLYRHENVSIEVAMVMTEENIDELNIMTLNLPKKISVQLRSIYGYPYTPSFVSKLIDQLVLLNKTRHVDISEIGNTGSNLCMGMKSYGVDGMEYQCHHYALRKTNISIPPHKRVSLNGDNCDRCGARCISCYAESKVDNNVILVPKGLCTVLKILTYYYNERNKEEFIKREDLEYFINHRY
ncbi:MAG: radical SAM protein [Paraclostridium sp.]